MQNNVASPPTALIDQETVYSQRQSVACPPRPIMKRILSEGLRRKDGVLPRNGRAGALRIEFIERSRNEPLGIEWLFAAYGAECSGRTGGLKDGMAASNVKTTDADGWRKNSRQVFDRPGTEIC
jgi:hypothetical protein